MYTMLLQNLRDICKERNVPIISTQTEEFLRQHLETHKPKYCLEIGSAVWYSTLFIASIIQKRNWQIISFEISYAGYLQALQHIKSAWATNITLYPFDFTTIDVRKCVTRKCDFVFVDGQKSQYDVYMWKIENIVDENSTIVLDDVIKYKTKLDKLYEYLAKKQINYQVLPMEEGDGIIVI